MFDFDSVKAVIFDVDGTLMDSVGRIIKTMRLSFQNLGLAEPDTVSIKNIIGLSMKEVAEKLLPEASEELRSALIASYKKIYTELEDREPTELFSDALPVLRKLRGKGYRTGLATGKSRRGCVRVLESYGLSPLIDVSVAGDEYPSKPAPDMLIAAAGALGLPVSSCLMVGDSALDLGMARKAGMPSAGVLTGVHGRERLAARNPAAIVGSLSELVELILGDAGGKS